MKAILFDLDGTLLPISQQKFRSFMEEYINSLAGYCASLAEPRFFVRVLLESTGKMMDNDGSATNEDVFMQNFLPRLGLKKEEIMPVLNRYYTTEYSKLSRFTESTDMARKIVQKAIAQGWSIVLATNPFFPRIAVEERMRWAGIEDFPWLYVSTYENSRSCKPNLSYYEDIADKLSLCPQECWMIGNDIREDMVAGKLGFNTYLLTDHMYGSPSPADPPYLSGTMTDLLYGKESPLA